MPNRILATLLIVFTASTSMAAGTCWSVFRKAPKIDPVFAWRADQSTGLTRTDGSRIKIATTPEREAVLQRHARSIQNAIYVVGDGPWTYFTEAPGVKMTQTQRAVYQTGKYPKYDVQTGGEAVLKATFALAPSGHVGSTLPEKIKNSEEYAKTDRIFLWVEVDGVRTDLVREMKSLGMATYTDMEIPLVKGKEVKLFYARYGKNDPLYIDRINGFMEGRVFGFTWDGN